MTKYSATSPLVQQVFSSEVTDTIASLLRVAERRDYFECSCQTSEGNKVRVQQIFTDIPGRDTQVSYQVQVWANLEQSPDEALAFQTTIQEYDLKTLFNLMSQLQQVVAQRESIDKQDSLLAEEESDLSLHVASVVSALCLGSED